MIILKEFLESEAEDLRVSTGAGVVGLVFNAAGKDLLFEAVESRGDVLEVERAAKGGGDELLS